MTNDEIIDIVLKKLYELNTSPIHDILYGHFKSIGKDINGFTATKNRIREIMYHEGLILNLEEHITITHLGKTIQESGGWLLHCDRLKEKQKLDEQIIIWESQLTKWNVKTRWMPHIFTGFGLCISIIALVVSLQKSPTEERLLDILQEQQKLQEHVRPTIQPTIDSLSADSLPVKIK